MPLLAYQSEDGTAEAYVRCETLASKPKFVIRGGKRLYPALYSQRKHSGAGSKYQYSESNGFIGTEADLRKHMAMDAKLGVQIRYVKAKERISRTGRKMAAYKAVFEGRPEKQRWLKAHKRVDFDAGYGDPVPGDFRKNTPPEFD